ncbi:MAG: TonB family protein [Proteobacteria bacterium]|nr:TonB family protein [Pseudomonadota bacterium]
MSKENVQKGTPNQAEKAHEYASSSGLHHPVQPFLRRWTTAWILAILFHLALVALLAWHLIPETMVNVSGMVPAPNETVELMPAQAIEPAVFFTSKPENLNGEAASLYRIESDGTRTLISKAHLHPKRKFGLQFEAIQDPGTYEIVVHDGENGVVSNPNTFDGEFAGKFPSGNREPGGIFSAQFKVEPKVHEIMTATLYDPQKPLANEEPAAKAMPQNQEMAKTQQKQVVPEPKPKPQPKQTKSKPKPKPTQAPTSPLVNETVSPVHSGEPSTDEPSPVPLTPESLRVSALNLAPELMLESAEIAQKNFEEHDQNKFVAAADLAKKRFESAYNNDGPVIGPGQQGNSLAHKKDVAEFLALMHKEIHPLWAHGYLLRLDTIYRQPGSRLNDSNLEAVLEITLDSLGAVSDVRMVRSSGITDYDNEAIHVAWNSSPGVPPPDEMRSNNGKSYIHWTFWRDQRQCGVFGVKVFKLQGNKRDALNFSLKAVQLQEKKLGLQPSVVNIPGVKGLDSVKSQNPDEPQEPVPAQPLERINPLDD